MLAGSANISVRQSRLVEDLSDSFRGELSVDPVRRALYSTDGSLYRIDPMAVACPRDRDDVVTLAKYAHEHQTPLIARGSGSNVAGGALGTGVIVDFSKFLGNDIRINGDTVRVGAGTVLETLNRELRRVGRYFAPDPANFGTTTVGGMLAVDAAGSHAASVGSMRDHVQSIEIVTAEGDCWETKLLRRGSDSAELPDSDRSTGDRRQLVRSLEIALERHAPAVRKASATELQRRGGGYFIYDVLSERGLDLPRLLVGSEGTLALFTAATLCTLPLPEFCGCALIVFPSLEAAVRSVERLADERPTACDLIDRRLLNLARETSPTFSRIIPMAAEAALIVEWSGWSSREIEHRLRRMRSLVKSLPAGCELRCEATTPDEVDLLWSLPRQVMPLLHRLQGIDRPLPFVEDIAVPVPRLVEFVFRAQKSLQAHGVTASLYAHALSGQLHLRPFLPATTAENSQRLFDLASELYEAVWDLGGTISGEHGAGLSRSGFVRRQAGALYPLFHSIKRAFDPHNLLNPGKILANDDELMLRDLRPPATGARDLAELQLNWSPEAMLNVAAGCNGCGSCRAHRREGRMCPMFPTELDEAASPRAKANLVREALSGSLPAHALGDGEAKRVADFCFNCKQCRLECPATVDIPRLVLEMKAAHVSQHGLTRAQWYLTRLPDWADWMHPIAPLINWALARSSSRWLLEKVLGIARRHRLPPLARRSFLRSLDDDLARPPANSKQAVIYFVDYFANHHDPTLAQACLAVLRRQGLQVHVPPRQLRSGMELITVGDLESARSIAEHNVRLLVEYAREGIPIVCSEPTAALCLTTEYPALLGTPEAQTVAEHTIEVGAYLARRHGQGQFVREFERLNLEASYHTPCHLRALEHPRSLLDLCCLIPGFHSPRLEAGCSGMAGTFGLDAANYQRSQQIASGLKQAIRGTSASITMTECSSCRMQLEHVGLKPSIHPLKILAHAYGLMSAREIGLPLTGKQG